MDLILASSSLRRKELLEKYGYKFTVVKSNFEEKVLSHNPITTSLSFALGKAEDVFISLPKKYDKVVLSADTIVYYDNRIFGKPKNEKDAFNMLKMLSGKTHSVITSYCIKCLNTCIQDYVESRVTFYDLSSEVIEEYIKSGSPMDKAGSYGIQDNFRIVKNYLGSLNNIIGLPIEIIKDKLNEILGD